jgi:hypothetical protein
MHSRAIVKRKRARRVNAHANGSLEHIRCPDVRHIFSTCGVAVAA